MDRRELRQVKRREDRNKKERRRNNVKFEIRYPEKKTYQDGKKQNMNSSLMSQDWERGKEPTNNNNNTVSFGSNCFFRWGYLCDLKIYCAPLLFS